MQEKRRREAGQRHWEEWVSRKARRCKTATAGERGENSRGGGGGGGGGGDDRQRERQEDEEKRRRKEQDEAFAAWARQKDKLLRARRREASVCAAGVGG